LLAQTLGLRFPEDDPVWVQGSRTLIYSGGWRSGKTTRAAFRGLLKALNPSTRLIWLVGPQYRQAEEEFRMMMEWGSQLRLLATNEKGEPDVAMPRDGIRSMTFITGCRVETRSAEHPVTLASVAPDFIELCEPGQMSPEVYEMCLGRLAEKRGDMVLAGTIESSPGRPRWLWYENLVREHLGKATGARERAFLIPTWTNTTIYPLGLDEPELRAIRERVSDYEWGRRYGGMPSGVDRPAFPLLWEGTRDEFFCEAPIDYVDGAIGADYGRTWNHPSAIVVVRVDAQGDYWVVEAWKGYHSDPDEIESIVEAFKHNYDVWQGCTDPLQGYLADRLGFIPAAGRAGSTNMRISLTNGLLEERKLFFDPRGSNVEEVYASLRMCAWETNARGELVFNRPVEDPDRTGDDMAQALMYAIECLRGGAAQLPPIIDYGPVRMNFGREELPDGRA